MLAKEFGLRGRHIDPEEATFVEFTAQTRMSGIDLDGQSIRKGAGDAVMAWIRQHGGEVPPELESTLAQVSGQGGTPLAVARDDRGRSASSTSRTSSRAASASASTRCAPWASAP